MPARHWPVESLRGRLSLDSHLRCLSIRMAEPLLSNVSDTARWVAVYRAWESARPDALFRDPFAERLAGERGKAIARLMPRQARSGWPLIVRTHLMDKLILMSVAEGCDCVINLAAGLDTRPYRLTLPSSLPWFEVDLPAMIEEKQQLLNDEQPVCRLSRHAADLSDPVARAALLDKIAGSSKNALVITRGSWSIWKSASCATSPLTSYSGQAFAGGSSIWRAPGFCNLCDRPWALSSRMLPWSLRRRMAWFSSKFSVGMHFRSNPSCALQRDGIDCPGCCGRSHCFQMQTRDTPATRDGRLRSGSSAAIN
jgi:hypothetical protein